MTNKQVFVTYSYEETQKLGERMGEQFARRSFTRGSLARLIALYGELGSGKTTFVQGLARGLGIKRRIISPTFVTIRYYKLKTQSSKRKTTAKSAKFFYHIDLYRIESFRDIKGVGIEEIINNPQNIVAIEWAEKIRRLLPEERIDIQFASISENKRKIAINIKSKNQSPIQSGTNIKNTK